MPVETISISLDTKGNCDIVDITPEVSRVISASDITSGCVTAFIPGSTAGITTIEYEPGAVRDLKETLNRLVPENSEYHHNLRWGDGNGHSHIRASLIGPSLTVPFGSGKLMLGTWQQIILVDVDNRPRRREIILQINGE